MRRFGSSRFSLAKLRLAGLYISCAIVVISSLFVIDCSAQTFKTIASFDSTNGFEPEGTLVQGLDGNLYGTTAFGGAVNSCTYGCGTIFKITPAGKLTTLYTFCAKTPCTDGDYPTAGLVLATNGNFYGTTNDGGANAKGTVFEITPRGKFTSLYSFCAETDCTDGATPSTGLVQATNGKLYGTTYYGGANCTSDGGCGTVFEISTAGKLTTLHSFDGTDGESPSGGLVQATDNDLYGTVVALDGYGAIFKITPGGVFSSLVGFDNTDGAHPRATLLQASNGKLYGTTEGGGINSEGTVFEVTTSGTLDSLLSFDDSDGENPYAGLIQATDGNLYGTTYQGGKNDAGTLFRMTTGGTLTTLFEFNAKNGGAIYAGLVQSTNGIFYGTTAIGGAHENGTVFRLSVGLGPFIETLPSSGKIGSTVKILGNNLKDTISVSFNGTPQPVFTASDTQIITKVPDGATSGTVTVTTTTATLNSNVVYRVTP